jgi:hypothetical protein
MRPPVAASDAQASRRPRARGRVAAALLVVATASCAGTPGAGTGDSSGRPVTGGQPAVAPDVGAGSAEARAALTSCPEEVWPADGSGEATHLGTHEGASVFQIAGSADAPATLVAVGKIRPGEPVACAVMEPSGSAPPVTGALWPLGGRVQAVLLAPAECNPELCPSTALVRDGERALGALFLPEACDRALNMEALSWFTGQDSLRLTCHQSAGAGHREIVYVLHVGASGLVPVFALETGTAEAATQEERETPGFCERRPVGWVRLVEKGERPVIKALDPARGQPEPDGKGTGLVVDFRFDPGTGRFAQIGAGTQERYDARAWCKK